MKKFLKPFHSISSPIPKRVLQIVGFFILCMLCAFFFTKGLMKNDIRLLTCTLLFLLIGSLCLRISIGCIAILTYLPFSALIRRWIYGFNPFVKLDPIHLIFPVLTLFMFGYVFIFHGEEIFKSARKNGSTRFITSLLVLFALEIFNPLQGGLTVGLSGVMYYMVPLMWFYFGPFISRERMKNILHLIIIIGIITAIYGLRQIYRGFLPFEEYWIKYGGFDALSVKGFTKAFSTFTNPQEYACYLSIALGLTFMSLWEKPFLYPLWIGIFILLLYGVFMTSSRAEIFLFFILVAIIVGTRLGNWKKALIASLIFLGIVFIGLSKIKVPSGDITTSKEAQIYHLARGVKHPFEKGSTLRQRSIMVKAALHDLWWYWFGKGLGATTMGVVKFGGEGTAGSEVFQFGISGSCGIPGIIIYLAIVYWIVKISIFLIKRDRKSYWIPGVISIWLIPLADLRLYSIGPFVYLLWGWISKEFDQYEKKD